MSDIKRISLGENIPDIIVEELEGDLALIKRPVKIPTQYMYRRLKIEKSKVDDYLSDYTSDNIVELDSGDGAYLEVP